MPIMHDSPEWQNNVNDVSMLKVKMGQMEINVAYMLSMQTTHHSENGNRAEKQEQTTSKLSTDVIRLSTINEQNTLWLKGIAIVLGLALTALGLWFVHLESNGKVSSTSSTATLSQPQDAKNPSTR